MGSYEKHVTGVLVCIIAVFFVFGFAAGGFSETLSGFNRLLISPARLIQDFTAVGGTGGAFFNAGIMGVFAVLLIKLNGIALSGPTFATVLTIMGFSLFGKTMFNAFPVVLGVFLASIFARKPFKSYIIMALFGMALGPLVSYIVFESGLQPVLGVPLGILAGIGAGMLLPAVSIAMLRLHEGFSLYNVGLACGFLSLFAASFFANAPTADTTMNVVWNTEPDILRMMIIPAVSALLLVWGLALERRRILQSLRRLFKQSGRLPSDFIEMVSPGAAFFNAGLMGLLACIYLFAIQADFNGPVIGALCTLIGFSAFGKHPRNTWPVAAGVVLAVIFYGKHLNAPGPVLAFIFSTTLAPLAGQFGPLVGIAAGFAHLTITEQSSLWYGGFNLYNNGFAGGLTAALFTAVIQWINSMKNN